MAQAIMKANGAGTFSSRGDLRLEIDILNNFGAGALENYAAQAYDNSGDYWLSKLDGTIVYDGSKNLRIETLVPGGREGEVIIKEIIISDTDSVSQALIQYIGIERAAEILGVDPANMSNYDEQTIKDVLGMDNETVARLTVNGQLTFDSLPLEQQQKLMGELLMKQGAGQTWSTEEGWHGDEVASFKITEGWDGYTVGFDPTMTNGEYDKFVVDIIHSRDVLSYYGSKGNFQMRKSYNGLDTSIYKKKNLKGHIIKAPLFIDNVQTVDNLWTTDHDPSTANYGIFGEIQGNTLVPNSPYFSQYGMKSGSFEKDVFVTTNATTFTGININGFGNDPAIGASPGRWLTHQATNEDSTSPATLLLSDGCVVNTDAHQEYINQELSNWGLYSGFNMGTVIKENWRNYYGVRYGY